MHIDGYVDMVREDLARVAAVGDESTARAADLLSAALAPAVGRRLQEALAEAALEISAQIDTGSVEVRLSGSDPELVFVPEHGRSPDPTEEAFSARITLRLPERLKDRVEAAAAAAAMSVNTWLVQTLQQSTESHRPEIRGRNRLRGYGRG